MGDTKHETGMIYPQELLNNKKAYLGIHFDWNRIQLWR